MNTTHSHQNNNTQTNEELRSELAVAHQNIALLQQSLQESLQRETYVQHQLNWWLQLLEKTTDGLLDWDRTADTITLSTNWLHMLAYTPNDFADSIPSYNTDTNTDKVVHIKHADFEQLIHQDDRAIVQQTRQHYLDGKTTMFRCQYRVRSRSGDWRWVLDRGHVVACDPNGTPQRIIHFHTDITEEKKIEEAVEHERQRLFSLLDELPAYVYLQEKDYSIRFVNRYFRDNFGDNARGMCYMLMRGRETPCDECPTFRVFDTHQPVNWEVMAMNGRTYQVYDYPFTDTDGTLLVLEMGIDITERKEAEDALRQAHHNLEHRVYERTVELSETNNALQAEIIERKRAEDALRKSQTLLQMIVDNLPTVVFVKDTHDQLLLVNKQYASLMQRDQTELVGMIDRDILPADVASLWHKTDQQVLVTGKPVEMEVTFASQDGMNTFLLIKFLLYDVAEGFYAIGGIATDITTRKHIEEALRESEARYRAIVEDQTDYVVRLRPDGTLTYVNEPFCRLFGKKPKQLLRRNVLALMPNEDRAQVQKHLQSFDATHAVATREHRMTVAPGRIRWIRSTDHAICDSAGTVVELQSVGRDITDQKQMEATLERERALLAQYLEHHTSELSSAHTELARASRLKDEILASISHELRTPINAVMGLSETLSREIYGPINKQQQEIITMIKQSGSRLLALINNILDLSKIEAGHLILNITESSINQLCQRSIQMVIEDIEQKNIGFSLHIDPHVEYITVDERCMKQILRNLLSNAAKFTPDGGKIGLTVESDISHQIVRFIVWDTGIGIKREDMTRLFKPFVQLDSGITRRFTGSGLGLTLVYRLSEQHGGSITVQSEPGMGSRFIITLPWQSPYFDMMKEPHPALTDQDADGIAECDVFDTIPILLVDDNDNMLRFVRAYLVEHGYQVFLAHNGLEALEQLYLVNPAIILMDLQMPLLGGLETIRRIRTDLTLAHIPIIIYTALEIPGEREKCLQAGATSYIIKPVYRPQLFEMIETIVQTTTKKQE